MLIEPVFTVTLVLILPSFVKSDIKSSFWNVKKTGSVQAIPFEKYCFEERNQSLRVAAYNYNKKENLSL